ncbi:acetylcholine receptor subunit alpha-1-B-like [Mytilus californianus]|uniref:acetylcholine receptor subunit alpha-1-B-like n=1 Tax=Mytilus californianus TaxID=6549 RepID=UPI00224869B8|nr:acetylcholine receptor subunit alpha-1-B-like [Mytilus californianus]
MDEANRLYSDLLNDYNKMIRPIYDIKESTKVNLRFSLISIKDFDEVTGKFSVIGMLNINWQDNRMIWNKTEYGNIHSMIFGQNDVWKPNLFLGNAFDDMSAIGEDFMTVRYYNNGTAIWTPLDMTVTSCSIDVTHFPFDQQTCATHFVPVGTLQEEIVMHSEIDHAILTLYSEHEIWQLKKTTAMVSNVDVGSMFSVLFTINRNPLFYLVNIMFPTILLTFLNSFVFLLPSTSGERISFSITVLLAIAVFMTMISSHLPKTSRTMSRLCYFLISNLIFSCIICLLTIIQLRLFHTCNTRSVPTILRRLVIMCNSQKHREYFPNGQDKLQNGGDTSDNEATRTDNSFQVSWIDVSKSLDIFMLLLSLCIQMFMLVALFVSILH